MMSHKQIDARAIEEIHRREENNISVNIETSRDASLHLHLHFRFEIPRKRKSRIRKRRTSDAYGFGRFRGNRGRLATGSLARKTKKISYEISFLRHFDSSLSILSPVFFSLESGLLFPPR